MSVETLASSLWMVERLTASDRIFYQVRQVLVSKSTDFQELRIVDTESYGKLLVLDGDMQSASCDEFIYHESLVHPAMLAQGAPRKVLILGGGEGATAREVLRWRSVERVAMVDIDGEVVQACREHLPEMHQGAFEDPRLELVIGDALEYLDTTNERWDVVISDLSEPIEHGPSFKLFTREYFEQVRKVMAKGGSFAMQAGPVSPSVMRIHVRLANTVASCFASSRPFSACVPSFGNNWGFVLASQQELPLLPDPATTDAVLAKQIQGSLRSLDGARVLAQRQLPPYLREALEQETQIYTLADPPKSPVGVGQL